ncbi:peptidoglycan editing factor PgeF [Salinimonas iocasae]|uniref:Purine nucleoside phosphorylase n=1 Tax=Salinimonas iocasae TaxID=2572577 RepID=A0A5B7YC25_9ALTE|nr:peptidoglycan editing factor PgeF [Salinimonas iocasae]QCZ93070.1 peptidoglycan editing factor PgeF [Salinimonas iocasae]
MASTTTDSVLISPAWAAPSSVIAYCSTRLGGVSQGAYASLNVGLHVNDNPVSVLQNRARLPGQQKLHWLNQVHGNNVVTLPSGNIDADASISCHRAHWCAVMTADCVPVLLCNMEGTEVAAVHAGWQGLDKKVIAKTIASMQSPASELMAWIGPAICQRHYQVDERVASRFMDYEAAVVNDSEIDKWRIDLPHIAAMQLNDANVTNITDAGLCTYSEEKRFFSHRRATHQGMSATGRMVSVIGIV